MSEMVGGDSRQQIEAHEEKWSLCCWEPRLYASQRYGGTSTVYFRGETRLPTPFVLQC